MSHRPAETLLTRRGVLSLLAQMAGFGLAAGCLLGPGCALGAEVYSEDAVKAAFLYRFAGYVTWPPQTMRNERSFTIAVLGADSVAKELEGIVANRSIDGLPVRVIRIDSVRKIGGAQMLYLRARSTERLREEIAKIASQPTLVVTDTAGGLDAGSTVNFLLVDRRVRFEVSLAAADRARLKVSAELLSVAARVEGDRRRSDISCAPFESFETRCPARYG